MSGPDYFPMLPTVEQSRPILYMTWLGEIERGVMSSDQEIDWGKHANGVYVLRTFSSGHTYSQRVIIAK